MPLGKLRKTVKALQVMVELDPTYTPGVIYRNLAKKVLEEIHEEGKKASS